MRDDIVAFYGTDGLQEHNDLADRPSIPRSKERLEEYRGDAAKVQADFFFSAASVLAAVVLLLSFLSEAFVALPPVSFLAASL